MQVKNILQLLYIDDSTNKVMGKEQPSNRHHVVKEHVRQSLAIVKEAHLHRRGSSIMKKAQVAMVFFINYFH